MDGPTYKKYSDQVAACAAEGNTRAIGEPCDRLLAEAEDFYLVSTLGVYIEASVLLNSRLRNNGLGAEPQS
jgi:hypothetical protein